MFGKSKAFLCDFAEDRVQLLCLFGVQHRQNAVCGSLYLCRIESSVPLLLLCDAEQLIHERTFAAVLIFVHQSANIRFSARVNVGSGRILLPVVGCSFADFSDFCHCETSVATCDVEKDGMKRISILNTH